MNSTFWGLVFLLNAIIKPSFLCKFGYVSQKGLKSISELGLFGSFARGDFNDQSDIDILVDFNGKLMASIIFVLHMN
jgi:hypothetical protein